MSNDANNLLIERASEAIEELASHPSGIDRRLQSALNDNDLAQVAYLVSIAEGILSQEEFDSDQS